MTTHAQRRTILAEHDGYELVRYPSGESRIEHPASGTCSVWLYHTDEAALVAAPADMARWRTDEPMDPPAEQ